MEKQKYLMFFKKTVIYVLALFISVSVLFIDSRINVLLTINQSGIYANALLDGFSVLLLVMISEYLENKLEMKKSLPSIAGFATVFIIYFLRQNTELFTFGCPIYVYFPTIMITVIVIKIYLTIREKNNND